MPGSHFLRQWRKSIPHDRFVMLPKAGLESVADVFGAEARCLTYRVREADFPKAVSFWESRPCAGMAQIAKPGE
jgi:hypothetical protein